MIDFVPRGSVMKAKRQTNKQTNGICYKLNCYFLIFLHLSSVITCLYAIPFLALFVKHLVLAPLKQRSVYGLRTVSVYFAADRFTF